LCFTILFNSKCKMNKTRKPGIVSAFLRRLAGIFLAGLLAIAPLVLTVAIVIWVTSFVEKFIGPKTFLGRQLESLGLKFASNNTLAYVIGWLFVLAAIFAIGLLVNTGARRLFHKLTDAVLKRIPLISNIYGTSKQLVEMFDQKNESELKAMSAVFCQFGNEGPGVLALMPSPERFRINGQDFHVVIIPTAPVPFGGGLLFMPVESVKPADMSVDGLISIYVSMGVTTSQYLTKDQAEAGQPKIGDEDSLPE